MLFLQPVKEKEKERKDKTESVELQFTVNVCLFLIRGIGTFQINSIRKHFESVVCVILNLFSGGCPHSHVLHSLAPVIKDIRYLRVGL